MLIHMNNILDFAEYRKWNRKCDICKVGKERVLHLETDMAYCDRCMSTEDKAIVLSLFEAKDKVLLGENSC